MRPSNAIVSSREATGLLGLERVLRHRLLHLEERKADNLAVFREGDAFTALRAVKDV